MRPKHTPDFSKLVGKPYEMANCWDLVREFYMSVFHIELSKYYNDLTPNPTETKNLISTNVGQFTKVEGPPEFGDIVLFKVRGIESHIGVYIGDGKFLHSSVKTGSVIDLVDRWKNVLVGYYRHKAAR